MKLMVILDSGAETTVVRGKESVDLVADAPRHQLMTAGGTTVDAAGQGYLRMQGLPRVRTVLHEELPVDALLSWGQLHELGYTMGAFNGNCAVMRGPDGRPAFTVKFAGRVLVVDDVMTESLAMLAVKPEWHRALGHIDRKSTRLNSSHNLGAA